MNDAANAAFSTQVLMGLTPGYGRLALAKTKDINQADILRVIKIYIAPIFNPASSIGSIAAGSAKVEELTSAFTALGYEVETRTFAKSDHDSEDGDSEGSEEEDEDDAMSAEGSDAQRK